MDANSQNMAPQNLTLPTIMWDLPRPGVQHMSPELAGGFSMTAPPGKPCIFLNMGFLNVYQSPHYCSRLNAEAENENPVKPDIKEI